MSETAVKEGIRRIDVKDWMAEGKALFGDEPLDWKFVCPNCGHIQTMRDFLELREAGIYKKTLQQAYYSCIGRFDTRIKEKDVGTILDRKSPCNYTLGGLFPFCKTVVIDEEGKENLVFEFAGDVVDGDGKSKPKRKRSKAAKKS